MMIKDLGGGGDMDWLLWGIATELSGSACGSRAPQLWAAQVSLPQRRTVTGTGAASLKAPVSVRDDLPAGGTGDWISPHLASGSILVPQAGRAKLAGTAQKCKAQLCLAHKVWEEAPGRISAACFGPGLMPRPRHLATSSFPQQNLWLLSPGVQAPRVPRPLPPIRKLGQKCSVLHPKALPVQKHWAAFKMQLQRSCHFAAGDAASQIKSGQQGRWSKRVSI